MWEVILKSFIVFLVAVFFAFVGGTLIIDSSEDHTWRGWVKAGAGAMILLISIAVSIGGMAYIHDSVSITFHP